MLEDPDFLRDSTEMIGDPLSEVFDLVEVGGRVSGGCAVRGPWVAHGAIEGPLKFFAMVCGRARLTTDGVDGPIELESGDGPRREIMPEADFASTRLIGADRGIDDVVVGCRIDLNPAGRALLLQALPPVGHVRASAAAATNLRGSLDRLFDEVTGNRMGSAFAIRQYGQLLLLEVLRAFVDQAELPQGWLRLLADERLRPALTLMHTAPAKPWGLEELARAATMSRTSFAERFRTVAGMPPLTYLNRWRMLLAQRALRDSDVRVGSLAVELRYTSESAFSNALKREVGGAPLP